MVTDPSASPVPARRDERDCASDGFVFFVAGLVGLLSAWAFVHDRTGHGGPVARPFMAARHAPHATQSPLGPLGFVGVCVLVAVFGTVAVLVLVQSRHDMGRDGDLDPEKTRRRPGMPRAGGPRARYSPLGSLQC